jgi:sialate O-acetylesterase
MSSFFTGGSFLPFCRKLRPGFLPLILCWAGLVGVRADVKLPAIFGDHMVLQRDVSVPVWGWADPGESVTVTAGGEKETTTTDKNGAWATKLTKLVISAAPIEVTVAGKNSITLHDVLVGDVWLCSGQSNMEFGIKAFLPPDEFTKAGDPQIRIFSVPKWVAPTPEKDIAPAPSGFPLLGTWQVCTPDALSKCGEWSGFSAVGYFFGMEVRSITHQPVGIIASSWGGTRIHSWTSLAMLKTLPAKATAAKNAAEFETNYDQIKQTYETTTLPQWNVTLAKWTADNKVALDAYQPAMKQWQEAAKAAAAQKQPAPPRPQALKPPRAPRDPIHDNQASCALFNGMIAPLVPFAMEGVVWYQGEANSAEPAVYKVELPALIRDWRSHWGQGDFPFLIVQLPNFMQRRPDPTESSWADMREVQYQTAASLPKTGVAITIDIGDAGVIHPADKLDVGHRLGLLAQHIAYGQANVFTGPTFKSSSIDGNHIRILFDNIGSGLTIGMAPTHFYECQRPPLTPPAPGAELEGFAVAGADQKFVWANRPRRR